MNEVLVSHATKALDPPIRVMYCDSFLCRLRGLMFRKHLTPQEGLLLVGNKDSRVEAAIHMLGVGMDLAVFWLDSEGFIVDRCLAKPWRPLYLPEKPARYVLELSAERMDDFNVGEKVTFEEIPAA